MIDKKINLKDAIGIMTSVCSKTYVEKDSIKQRFSKYDENKEFTLEELQAILKEFKSEKAKEEAEKAKEK